jgi:GH35 family endo-1,4-beta-xylanase
VGILGTSYIAAAFTVAHAAEPDAKLFYDGLEVQVAELDLSVYAPGIEYTPDQFFMAETFTDEVQARQAAR